MSTRTLSLGTLGRGWTLWASLVVGLGCGGDESTPSGDAAAGDAEVALDASETADLGPDSALPDAALGDAAVGEGRLALLSPELDFGEVAVGQRGEAELVVLNLGDGPAELAAFEGLAEPFGLSRALPLTIPAEGERTLVFTFSAQVAGPVEATWQMLGSGAPDGLEVTVRGVGVVPQAELLTPVVDLGRVGPGEPAAGFIELANRGEAGAVRVAELADLAAPFRLPQGQLPLDVAPGETGRVLVEFEADADGEYSVEALLKTNAGEFPVTVRASVLGVGELPVSGVEPAWAAADTETTLVVHGGPFEEGEARVLVGDVALEGLERVDASRLRGRLPAQGAPAPGTEVRDVRVELGGRFGLAPSALVVTPPVVSGSTLDAAALAGPIGPEGNPWRVAVESVDGDLEVRSGTVLLVESGSLRLRGRVIVGGEAAGGEGGGPVVFSSAAGAAGSWAGLVIEGAGEDAQLTGVVVEYAGAMGQAAVRLARGATVDGLTIRQAAGDGLAVAPSTTLFLLRGDFTDLGGDAISLESTDGGDGGWTRLQRAWVRRARAAVRGHVAHFGRQPLGQGNDWDALAEAGITLVGPLASAVTLTAQPLGVRYGLGEGLVVSAGGHLTLGQQAPLVVDAELRVEGRLTLPAGSQVRAAAGGALVVATDGALDAPGTAASPVVIGARARDEDEPAPGAWRGVLVEREGALAAAFLTLRDAGAGGAASLELRGAPGEPLVSLRLEDGAGPAARIAASVELVSVTAAGNAAGFVIESGEGRITGTTADPAPQVEMLNAALCPGWDVANLTAPGGGAIVTSCD